MKRHGFTLIELLVVVAIIGVVAAVGTVAYTGYTSSAKVSVAKERHHFVVRYIQQQLTLCETQNIIFDGNFNCKDRFIPSTSGWSPIMVLSKLWGSGTSNPKFRHPKGTYSAVVGTVPNYFARYARNSCGGSTGDQFEFDTRMENTAKLVTVWTCINKNTSDRLISQIPIQ